MGLNDEIKDAVDWSAPSIDVDDTIRVCIRKMAESGASALAVKSGDDVVGVLTDMDLMGCIEKREDPDTTKASSCMTACELIMGKAVKSPCVQLDSEESVANALGVMSLAGVHHLLVSGENERRTGLVSIVDLLKLSVK